MGAQVFNLSTNRMTAYSNSLSVNRERQGIQFCSFATAYLSKCRKSAHAKKAYQSVMDHFEKFCSLNGLTLMTYEIGMEVMEDFVFYMQSVAKLMSSTVFGHVSHIKTLLKMASFSKRC